MKSYIASSGVEISIRVTVASIGHLTIDFYFQLIPPVAKRISKKHLVTWRLSISTLASWHFSLLQCIAPCELTSINFCHTACLLDLVQKSISNPSSSLYWSLFWGSSIKSNLWLLHYTYEHTIHQQRQTQIMLHSHANTYC